MLTLFSSGSALDGYSPDAFDFFFLFFFCPKVG